MTDLNSTSKATLSGFIPIILLNESQPTKGEISGKSIKVSPISNENDAWAIAKIH